MRASLDTNIIIHFYRAGRQDILFDFFDEGVFIHAFIRDVELEHHGAGILAQVDADIASGKINVYTDDQLKVEGAKSLFDSYLKENRLLYRSSDLGEVYAIALAQTMGIIALITDDIKQGGPYMSLLQLTDYYEGLIPMCFTDILILRYLFFGTSIELTLADYNSINNSSNLEWSLSAKAKAFSRRFIDTDDDDSSYGYERKWITELAEKNHVDMKGKIKALITRRWSSP